MKKGKRREEYKLAPHTNPRHPNTSVSPNRMAGLYAIVGVRRDLQNDPSITPHTPAQTTITPRICKSIGLHNTINLFVDTRVTPVFYMETGPSVALNPKTKIF